MTALGSTVLIDGWLLCAFGIFAGIGLANVVVRVIGIFR